MKKTISILLSFLMVLSALTAGFVGVVASAETTNNGNFLLPNPKPDGWGNSTVVANQIDPYNSRGRVFSLSTMNELYFYESRNKDDDTTLWDAWTFDNCPTGYKSYSNGNYWMQDPNLTNSSPSTVRIGEQKDMRLSYVQSVGFDPTGSGKKTISRLSDIPITN